jgi:hypothetical protein
MNCKSLWLTVAVLVMAGVAQAQPYYGGAWVDNRASTPGQAAAYGMAEMARGAGQYNLMTSEAAINMTEAQKRNMENREQWTNTYFQMRAANKQYREAERGPAPSMEDLVRYAQAGKPKQLSPSELDTISGDISWPTLLQTDQFSEYRSEIEELYAQRAQSGSLSWDDQRKVDQTAKALLKDLRANVRDLPPQEYMAAKRFVESLTYEARRPAG